MDGGTEAVCVRLGCVCGCALGKGDSDLTQPWAGGIEIISTRKQ